LHVVFEDQYSLYEPKNPFQDARRGTLDDAATNKNGDDRESWMDDASLERTGEIKSKHMHKTKKSFLNNSQNYVFIKVNNRHQYDMNPKLIKFFLAEVLKEQKNRAKLFLINKKLDKMVKEKIIKFGLQQY
jgi:hypothetical protein